MQPSQPALVALVAALVFPSCAPGSDHLSTRDDAIRGGTPASAGQFPTVVALVSQGLCTGTLVAPDIVLTAAHCVHPSILGVGSQDEVTAMTRVVLDDLNLVQGGGGRSIAAADTVPVASFASPGDPDIGLVFLAEDVTDREPSVINPDGVGLGTLPVDLVGFGQTDTGGFGQLMFALAKPQASCSAFGVDGSSFICLDQSSGSGICQGDSGGPAFAAVDGQQRVVGITSFGDQGCMQLGAHYRTDSSVARDFLRAEAPELLCRADAMCDALCDAATPDPDCATPCTSATDCADGEVCGADGTCEPEPFAPGGLGSACENNTDCASGLCADGDGERLCSDECTPGGASSCPDGFACAAAGDGGLCWPSESGGCSASGGAGGGTLLLLGALVVVRRRRPGGPIRLDRRSTKSDRSGPSWIAPYAFSLRESQRR